MSKNCEYVLANAYYFSRGESLNAYDFLGSHRISDENGMYLYSFAFCEKDATWVELVGEFNDKKGIRMTRLGACDIWYAVYGSSICIDGSVYEYRVKYKNGETVNRYDPFSEISFCGDCVISTVRAENNFVWSDKKYMSCRKTAFVSGNCFETVSIYEAETLKGVNYRELGDTLARSVSRLGYTHVKLNGVRNRLDTSLFSGCFAPSLRYGSSDDFSYLINKLHSVNVGVIIDLFPSGVSFTEDDLRVPENRSLMMSCVAFWYRNYHVDGVSVDTDNVSLCDLALRDIKKSKHSELCDLLTVVNGKIRC